MAIQVSAFVNLQMRLETFLLTERLIVTFGIWARGRVLRPHVRLKLRPSGEKR